MTVASSTFPVSTINLLENTSQSWYDAGYVNVRRRYANGLSFLANYTFAKALENAPDFRSPMFEAATPQNNDDLNAEKGPGCDIRNRFALSAVYILPGLWHQVAWPRRSPATGAAQLSTRHRPASRCTISVFGDTANAGTVVGENPIRANMTGPEGLPIGNPEFNHVVQSRRVRHPACLHLRQRGPQLSLRSRIADHGSGSGARIQRG